MKAGLARLRDRLMRPGGTVFRVASNASWLVADRILRLAGAVLVGAWVARYLGRSAFGELNYAQAIVALGATIAAGGVDAVAVRELVANPDDEASILGSAFALKVAGAALSTVLAWLVSRALGEDDRSLVPLVLVLSGATLAQAADIGDLYFQARLQVRVPTLVRTAAFGVATLARIALILARASLLWFAAVTVAEAVLGAGGVLMAYSRQRSLFSWHLSSAHARRLVRDGWPLALSAFAVMLYMRIDQVMLGKLVNREELGLYSAAVRIAEMWYFVPMAVVTAATPAIVEAHALGREVFEARVLRLYRGMVALSIVVAVTMTFVGPWAVRLLYGPGYAGAGRLVVGLVWGGVFVALGAARAPHWLADNMNRLSLATTALGAAVNIGLNFVLLPRYGAWGAVVATAVSQWLAAHGACIFFKRSRRTATLMLRALFYPVFW